jgi:hypothetical protein
MRERGQPPAGAFDETVELLFTLTSFETFDTLAGDARTPEGVAPAVRALAFTALGVAPE